MAGIYIHIPFCKQACHYCDFHFSTSLQYKDELFEALLHELKLRKSYLSNETIETIYLGGGTPSLLNEYEINRLFEQINKHYTVSNNAECTLEANPDDLNKDKIQQIHSTPINRLSIGIQSFFDEDLRWMNRAHTASEAEDSIKRSQDIGLSNISIDLIYGIPGLSDIRWKENISRSITLQIPHISSYALTVEPKTALAHFIKTKKVQPPSDEQASNQFNLLMTQLEENDFLHYEISNFCKEGFYSKHNSSYWKGESYLGIGPSAHSYNKLERQWNIANNAKYISALNQNEIPASIETLTITNRFNEYVMISLRTMWGIDLDYIRSNFGDDASTNLIKSSKKYITEKLLIQEGTLIKTSKEGKHFADRIASELFIDL